RYFSPSNQPHPYNLFRATQHPTDIGHVPEIIGHVRRNTHRRMLRASELTIPPVVLNAFRIRSEELSGASRNLAIARVADRKTPTARPCAPLASYAADIPDAMSFIVIPSP
ncbi:hypothetical protein, partial [Variovorax sp. GT1P44]|uniref:hypothetical protein n=1 Tax=Variovorax sp. GT1P44 TaxID=3443742 RepID=UPI003F473135